jgi:hypothetical protein
MTSRPTRPRRERVERVRLGDHCAAVYTGREMIGEVLIGRSIRAVDRDRNLLGSYPSRQAAMTAIVAAWRRQTGSPS